MARRRRSRRTHTASDLTQVAWSQKVLIVCLLGHLFLWLGYIGMTVYGIELTEERSESLNVVLMLAAVAATLWDQSVVSYWAIVGAIVGLLTVVPCVGLLLVLIVNTRATSALQANGVKVGLLGARMSDLAALSEDMDDEDFEDDEDDRPRRRRSAYDVDEREGW